MKKVLPILLVVLMVFLASCTQQASEVVQEDVAGEPVAESSTNVEVQGETEGAAEPVEEESVPFFGFVMHNFESQFSVNIKIGAENACKDMGVDCEVTGPTAMNAPEAISMFESLLARNPSGMALVPNPQDPWIPVLNQYAEEAKIIMVSNGDAPGTPRQAYFGADEYAFGAAEAEAVIDAGVTSGKVIIGSCYPPALSLQHRFDGAKAVFDEYPEIELLGPIDITAEQTTNYAAWENLVTANPDIKAGIGLCTFSGPSFAKLMPTLDFDFVTVTADLIPETLDAIEAGYVDAAVGQHPYLQGYLPMYYMAKYVVEGADLPAGQVLLPAEIVTKDNLETVLDRQNDTELAEQWYANFLAENLSDIEANIIPFE